MRRMDRFLLKIDYDVKFKFLIFSTLFCTLIIAFMFFEAYHGIKETLEIQQSGLQANRALNSLIQKMGHHHFLRKMNVSEKTLQIQQEIDADLKEIINLHKGLKLDFSFHALIQDWNEMKKDFFTESNESSHLQHLKLMQGVSDLMAKSSDAFRLTSNMDPAANRILHALAIDIPAVQSLIPQILNSLENIKSPPEEKELSHLLALRTELKKRLNDIDENLARAAALNPSIVGKLQQDNKPVEINTSNGLQILDESIQLQEKIASIAEILIGEQMHRIKIQEWTGIGLIAFGFCMMGLLTLTQFSKGPLAELKEAAEKLAGGDVSVRIDTNSKNETGTISDLFNELAARLEKIKKNKELAFNDSKASSDSLYQKGKELEKIVSHQENGFKTIGENASHISTSVQDFHLSLAEANHLASLTTQSTVLGKTAMAEMEATMQRIGTLALNLSRSLCALGEKVKSLDKIVNAMIIMADQANLLSLNTLIQATKEGVDEIGFSIISEKINGVANQVAKEALEAEVLYKNILSVTSKTISEANKYSDEIHDLIRESAVIRTGLANLMARAQEQARAFGAISARMQKQIVHIEGIQALLNELSASSRKATGIAKSYYQLARISFNESTT